jgi:hypothetical protein
MKFNNINFESLLIEREYRNAGIYSRTLYFDPNTNKYIKTWNKDFFYKKYFKVSVESGYFSDISLFEETIEDDKKNILGYITPKAKPIFFPILEKHKYEDLINRLVINCNNFNIIYIDLNPSNIVEQNNKYYIIDLEPSIPINCLKEIPDISTILEYNCYSYIKKISNLLSSVIDVDSKIKVVRNNTYYTKEIKYGTADGRIYIEQEYLPQLSGKTLFIGVNYYTDFYHQLTKNPELFETLDILEDRIEHGSPYKHYVCNILDFRDQGYLYDNVCLFGVLGHADDWDVIQKREEILRCMEILDSLVAAGGTLLLGPGNWSHDIEFWDDIYNQPMFKKYTILMLKKIGRNYVWYGRKNG